MAEDIAGILIVALTIIAGFVLLGLALTYGAEFSSQHWEPVLSNVDTNLALREMQR